MQTKKKIPLLKSRRQSQNPAAPRIDHISIARSYAEKVVSEKGKKKYGVLERLSAKRFLSDIKKSGKHSFGYYLCSEWSFRACHFFSNLPHVKGNWPTSTVVLEPWQIFFLVNVYGWRSNDDPDVRRFTMVYLEVARKNGKSFIASGMGLFGLTCEGELGPEVPCAATTYKQARIVFDVAKKMVEKTPAMRRQFKLEMLKDSITCFTSGGIMEPIHAKSSTQDGLNPHCSIIDELHAHKDSSLFDVLRSARGARHNPLTVMTTTAGYNAMGVCYDQHKILVRILKGIIEAEHYFGMIFTIDKKDNPMDESVWRKSNPNWECFSDQQKKELRSHALEARQAPKALFEFKTKRLNIWTTSRDGHINLEKWVECDGEVDLEFLREHPCWGAIDLASVQDLASFRLVWDVDGILYTWGKNYCPEDAVNYRTDARDIPYRDWVDRRYITATPGGVINYSYIEKDIRTALSMFDIKAIGFDRWNATDLTNRLEEDGAPLIEFRQGPQSYNAAMRDIDRRYLSGKLAHGGDPVLTWCASNVVAREDVNKNMAPDKKNSFEKIDAYVTLAMATALCNAAVEVNPAEPPSVYEERGVVEIEV
jgi:phage terminase large subunit-like protein